MKITHKLLIALLCISISACELVEPAGSVEDDETSTTEQPGISIQGISIQGISIQGISIQGMSMQGFRFGGATLGGVPLKNVRVERGELVAQLGQATLRGAELVGAQLQAELKDPAVHPPATVLVTYRIASVAPEDPAYDPTQTGSTFLYTLEQRVTDTSSWQPACGPDADGRRVAIPVAAIWDERGNRVESSTMFTFGCTTGVVAKCYRWGYRPWVSGYGNLAEMHWTCTRLARADYCGNGTPFTQDGTWINIWDTLPAPGPIQQHGPKVPGMVFEAGWTTSGAVCLSHPRWLSMEPQIAAMCPERLIPAGQGKRLCNTVGEAFGQFANVRLFNESYIQY